MLTDPAKYYDGPSRAVWLYPRRQPQPHAPYCREDACCIACL